MGRSVDQMGRRSRREVDQGRGDPRSDRRNDPRVPPLELDVFVQELEAHTPGGDPGLERDPYRDEGGEG